MTNAFSNLIAVKEEEGSLFVLMLDYFELKMNVSIEGLNGFELLEKLNLVDAPLRTEVFRAKDTRWGQKKYKSNNHSTTFKSSREKELEKRKIFYYTRLKRQRRDFHEQIYKGQCC